MKRINIAFMIIFSACFARPASAEELGPVATNCKAEIAKFCADKKHGRGEVRACLDARKEELSDACKKALETTGPGRGKGQGKGRKSDQQKP